MLWEVNNLLALLFYSYLVYLHRVVCLFISCFEMLFGIGICLGKLFCHITVESAEYLTKFRELDIEF